VLTGKQKRQLRARGHALHAVVQVGKEGISETVVQEASDQLEAHELIKIRVGGSATMSRKEVASELSQKTSSEVAQILGKTILLYRKRREDLAAAQSALAAAQSALAAAQSA